ncbi:S-adenosyl-L-methionine-dependent methyltransferase [Coniophora puteana RWD-64-598 SS2]|uniref:S-adenosyl-L-methionine-dependent methyltransferase n=1 Tax=Coniophora puteana (strain RWD-64-598) TaxID=741705 RepID=A0A5M3MSK8_CONPW|nr:S-adenosyl-L-methionine-dependent methyltransferase [Coniophora puteana RWD-64-598 SS2]EIW82080.1 S-adenosyl-L-methionine-dependent methyltransferase [Coniophora puteana RWD-64-598 SS2]
MFSYPHLQSPTLYPLSQPWQSDKYPLTILSSVQSTTGVVVVGDILPAAEGSTHSLRYLRASHSLIGGVWLDDKVVTLDGAASLAVDKSGTPLGDPIYSAFVLQEAARLVSSTPQGKSGDLSGLGAGTSASALVQHGISTTIVEIDPAVYDAARQYFGLPELAKGHVFLEDARNWAQERRRLAMPDPATEVAPVEVDIFDIIIHDCFSGGSVPEHLYSLQFWEDLKVSLDPEGVVAVNFAGSLASDASKGVATTLMKAFGQCRAFHDSLTLPLTQEQYESEFMNIVFFCSPSARPLEFRLARNDDYLNSHLRARILSTLAMREVSMDEIRGSEVWTEEQEQQYLITDFANKLGDWQQGGAFDHWKLMREVLPDAVWEAY